MFAKGSFRKQCIIKLRNTSVLVAFPASFGWPSGESDTIAS